MKLAVFTALLLILSDSLCSNPWSDEEYEYAWSNFQSQIVLSKQAAA
ncbi:MAG: hypothetical protein GX640_13970 [Fibrobacter sp.]|jgi:hypothetical protein|nr:hypothetical protein [Fibrobacter sp.]